ncbi:MAG: hypothetical protein ACQGVC_18670 [Myxococcota bacterium]
MTDRKRRAPDLSPRERRFVDRLNASFAPPAMSPARRTSLDARVRERIEHPRRPRMLVATLAAGSAVALASLWLALPLGRIEPEPLEIASLPSDAWERRLLLGDVSATRLGSEPSALPPEYAAIDRAFLDR